MTGMDDCHAQGSFEGLPPGIFVLPRAELSLLFNPADSNIKLKPLTIRYFGIAPR
jgi:hypothetical protein